MGGGKYKPGVGGGRGVNVWVRESPGQIGRFWLGGGFKKQGKMSKISWGINTYLNTSRQLPDNPPETRKPTSALLKSSVVLRPFGFMQTSWKHLSSSNMEMRMFC